MNAEMELLKKSAETIGLSFTQEQLHAFQFYMEQLLHWNAKINLTAITDPKEFIHKHFLDSLWPLQWISAAGKTGIDVGTGAGFPGIPLKIAEPQLQLTLLDSLQKRLHVLEAICGQLHLAAELQHARAEEASRLPALREQFDLVFARAVAPLSVLCEYCLPFVRVGGSFCAWKGPAGEEELYQAKKALQVLGGAVKQKRVYTLPDGSPRMFLEIAHIRACPSAYPRAGGKIKKQPLEFSTKKFQEKSGC